MTIPPSLSKLEIQQAIYWREGHNYSMQRIADFFGVSNVTVAKWFRRAGRADLCGRKARQGRKPREHQA